MTKLLVRGRGSGDVVMTVVGVTSVPHVVIIVAVVVVVVGAAAATVAATVVAGSGVALGPTASASNVASCIDVDDAGATVCIGGLLMSPFRSSSSAIFKFWS